MITFGVRVGLTIILIMILELLVINVAGLFPFLAVHKADISGAPFIDFIMGNLLHPIEKSTIMIKEKNPLFYLGSGAVMVLAIYVSFFMKSGKGRYELADSYGVHGSSRFAKRQEIFKQGETINVPVNQLMNDLEASMQDTKGGR